MRLRARDRRKTPAFYAADSLGKRLFAAGVPERYWDVEYTNLAPPSDFLVPADDSSQRTHKRVTSAKQRSALETLLSIKGMSGRSGLIIASSSPTDEWAVALGSVFVRSALNHRILRVEMLDVSNPIPSGNPLIPEVLVLYNVMAESPRDRIAMCRDWISFAEGSLIFLAVGGAEPRDFADNVLRRAADFEFYMEGQFRIRKVFRT